MPEYYYESVSLEALERRQYVSLLEKEVDRMYEWLIKEYKSRCEYKLNPIIRDVLKEQ